MDIIWHFAHKHRLKLTALDNEMHRCSICSHVCSGPTYVCTKCDFFLHKSCAEMPREFRNPFHPHPLTLMIESKWDLSSDPVCDTCFYICGPSTYRCNLCAFVLDLKCAFLIPTVQADDKQQLQHFTHFHPLELVELKDDRVDCFACSKGCSNSIFFCCFHCRFFLHKSCAELQFPQKIQHFFHPCTVTLSTEKKRIRCKACQISRAGFSYSCEKCRFELDVECALLISTMKSDSEEKLLPHFSHGHPLKLSLKKEGDEVQCCVCDKRCLGQTYVCDRCEFFLHQSCAGLEREIQHPFHPIHPLTLHFKNSKLYSKCRACRVYKEEFTYGCSKCHFYLHIGCCEITPTIQYKGHRHLLTSMEKICVKKLKCNSCKSSCEGLPVFKCGQCNFTIHIQCGPLPCIIKDKCHIHSLSLTESPIEDVDWNGFCCDVCEEERDPRLPIYYCAECKYIAEIKCVISEVFRTLKGEYGDVELRTSSSQIPGKVVSKSNKREQKKQEVTLHDFLKSFTEDEKLELNGVLEAAKTKTSGTRKILSDDHQNKDDDSMLEVVLLFSDKFYKLFMEKIEAGTEDSIILWKEYEEIIAVQDFMVTSSLAPILEELCAKYGDISAESTLRPRVKTFFFVMLCGTIDCMLKTKIEDVFENLLSSWWKYLKTLQFAGFKIQFALDHWKKVAHAFLGIHISREIDKVTTRLEKSIREISYDVESLTVEIEATEKNLEERKEKRELLRSAESEKSSFIMECLREASKLRWSLAGEGLV